MAAAGGIARVLERIEGLGGKGRVEWKSEWSKALPVWPFHMLVNRGRTARTAGSEGMGAPCAWASFAWAPLGMGQLEAGKAVKATVEWRVYTDSADSTDSECQAPLNRTATTINQIEPGRGRLRSPPPLLPSASPQERSKKGDETQILLPRRIVLVFPVAMFL